MASLARSTRSRRKSTARRKRRALHARVRSSVLDYARGRSHGNMESGEETPAGAAFSLLRRAVARRREIRGARFATLRMARRSTATRRRRQAGGKIRIGGHGPPRRRRRSISKRVDAIQCPPDSDGLREPRRGARRACLRIIRFRITRRVS